jgi:lipooligosaccharide transport system permease protein
VRHAVFGFQAEDFWHLGFILAFGLLMWRVAIARMERRLVD